MVKRFYEGQWYDFFPLELEVERYSDETTRNSLPALQAFDRQRGKGLFVVRYIPICAMVAVYELESRCS
jgi:hypothetical protein